MFNSDSRETGNLITELRDCKPEMLYFLPIPQFEVL